MKRLLACLVVALGLSGAARAADVGPLLIQLTTGASARVFVTPANIVYGQATYGLPNGQVVSEPVIGQLIPGVYLWVAIATPVDQTAYTVILLGNGTAISATFGSGAQAGGVPGAATAPVYFDSGRWAISPTRDAPDPEAELRRRMAGE